MSLNVYAVFYDKGTGKISFIDTDPTNTLAGTEESRFQFWGAEVMHILGLTILPQLSTTNILVVGKQLHELEREVENIIQNIELVSEETHYTEEFISQRLGNVLDAIKKALELDGGVIIQ